MEGARKITPLNVVPGVDEVAIVDRIGMFLDQNEEI
jgi:hypothetical protein